MSLSGPPAGGSHPAREWTLQVGSRACTGPTVSLRMTVQCLHPCRSRAICVTLPSSPGTPHLALIGSDSRPVLRSARQWALGRANQIKSLSYEYRDSK